jgi:hypothetical protein
MNLLEKVQQCLARNHHWAVVRDDWAPKDHHFTGVKHLRAEHVFSDETCDGTTAMMLTEMLQIQQTYPNHSGLAVRTNPRGSFVNVEMFLVEKGSAWQRFKHFFYL